MAKSNPVDRIPAEQAAAVLHRAAGIPTADVCPMTAQLGST